MNHISLIGRSVLVFSVLLSLAFSATAQPVGQEPKELPSAESILDRHVAATGGKEAHLKLQTRKITGTMAVDLGGHKFQAAIEKHLQAPNNSHLLVNGNFIFQVKVNNDQHAWEWRAAGLHDSEEEESDDGNTTLLDPAETRRVIEASRFHAAVNWRQYFEKVETIGIVEVSGRPAFQVAVTKSSGDPSVRFYDQEHGRLVRYDGTVEQGHAGKLQVETYVEDYQLFDGVWLPTRVRQQLDSPVYGKGSQIWINKTIEHNVKIPASMFTLPAELQG